MIRHRLTVRFVTNLARFFDAAAVRLRGWASAREAELRGSSDGAEKNRESGVVDYVQPGLVWSGSVPPKHWLDMVERHAPGLLQPSYRRATVDFRAPRTSAAERPSAAWHPERKEQSASSVQREDSERNADNGTAKLADAGGFFRGVRDESLTAAPQLHRRNQVSVVEFPFPGTNRPSSGDRPERLGKRSDIPKQAGDAGTKETTSEPGNNAGSAKVGYVSAARQTPGRESVDRVRAERWMAATESCSKADDSKGAATHRRGESVSITPKKVPPDDVAAEFHLRFRASVVEEREALRRAPPFGRTLHGVRRAANDVHQHRPLGSVGTDDVATHRQSGRGNTGSSRNGVEVFEEPAVVPGGREPQEFATRMTMEFASPTTSRHNRHSPGQTDPLVQPWPELPDSVTNTSWFEQGSDLWPELPGDEHVEPIPCKPHGDGYAAASDLKEWERLRMLELEQRGVRWKE